MIVRMPSSTRPRLKAGLSVRELAIFALLGVFMFLSKLLMEALPNIHLLGTLTVAYTLTYRKKALIPIYTYVFLNGLYAGFSLWWMPYLYIWTILWGMTMLVPRRLPHGVLTFLLPVLSALHGLAFGTLYAPAQALLFGFDFKETLAWIATGLPFDLIHAFGNLLLGFLILPLYRLLYFLTYREKI